MKNRILIAGVSLAALVLAVDDTEFSFDDMDNPDAFDDLLDGGNP